MNEETGNNVANNYNEINYYKHFIVTQRKRINSLIEEIAYLSEDSANRTIIINTLSVFKSAQNYFSHTPKCANLSTARKIVCAKRFPRFQVTA